MVDQSPSTPRNLTVKERIERRLAELVAAIPGVRRVERWDAVRENPGGDLVALIIPGDEDTVPDAEGGDFGATDSNTLPVAIELEVAPDAADGRLPAASLHNEWLGALAAAVLADADVVDGWGDRLAVDIRKVGSSNPATEEDRGSFITVLEVEVTYVTYRADLTSSPTAQQRPALEGYADGQ